MLYQTTPRGQRSKQKASEAAKRYQEAMKQKRGGVEVDTSEMGVRMTSFSMKKIGFIFYGVEFTFNPLFPLLGGFVIASIAAFLGVGGGFLLVPFITAVAGLPMYLAAGTSALAVLVGQAGLFWNGNNDELVVSGIRLAGRGADPAVPVA